MISLEEMKKIQSELLDATNSSSETKWWLWKKGCIPWNKGKTDVYSQETIQKMRGVRKNRSACDKESRCVDNKKQFTQRWILQHRCCHCGRQMRDDEKLKNCSICREKRAGWGWKKKLMSLQRISSMTVPTCKICGLSDLRLLTINHLNGTTKTRRIASGEPQFYHLYNSIIGGKTKTDDLEVRCYNCNILYEFEIGRRTYFGDDKK